MHEMLRNWSKKLGSKFSSTALAYSLVRISLLGPFILDLEASPGEGQQPQQKERCKKIKKHPKPNDVSHLMCMHDQAMSEKVVVVKRQMCCHCCKCLPG